MREESSESLNLLIGVLVLGGILSSLIYLENPELYWDISSSIQTVVAANLAYFSQLMVLGFLAINFAWWKIERFAKLTLQGSRLRKIKSKEGSELSNWRGVSLIASVMLVLGFIHHNMRFVDILDDGGWSKTFFLSLDLLTWVVLGTSATMFIVYRIVGLRFGTIWPVAEAPKITNGLVLGTEYSACGKKRVG